MRPLVPALVRLIIWIELLACSVMTAYPFDESSAMLLGARFVLLPETGKGIAGGSAICVGGVVEEKNVEFKPVNVGCTATLVQTCGNGGGVKSPCPPIGALLTTETGKRPGDRIWLPAKGPINCRALKELAMFNLL